MPLEAATYLAQLISSNPDGADDKSEGDNHLRLIKGVLLNTFPGMGGAAFRVQSKGANYTVVANDNTSVFRCTAAITLALTAAATLGNRHFFLVQAASGDVVIDPDAAEQINGAASVTVESGGWALVFCDGTAFYAIVLSAEALATTIVVTGAANTFTANQIFQLSDDGAAEGPLATLQRISTTPAANDLLGALRWTFRDDAGNTDVGIKLLGELVDPASGTEDVRLLLQTIVAGTLATRMTLQNGLFMAGVTGGDPGAGKINAVQYFREGGSIGSIALVRDEKADGTDGGASTGGGTWDKRTLNTEVFDPDSIVSLASDEFTLQSGKYKIRATAPMELSNGGRGRIKLRNVTDGVDYLGNSITQVSPNAPSQTLVEVTMYVSISAAKAFAIYTAASVATATGLGVHDNMTLGNEVYTEVLIEKIG